MDTHFPIWIHITNRFFGHSITKMQCKSKSWRRKKFIFWLPTHFSHFDTEKYLTRLLGICNFGICVVFHFLWEVVLFRDIKSRKQTTFSKSPFSTTFPLFRLDRSIDRERQINVFLFFLFSPIPFAPFSIWGHFFKKMGHVRPLFYFVFSIRL